MLLQKPEKLTLASKKLTFAKSGVDDDATALLDYNNQFEGKIHVSIKNDLDNVCIINGSKGSIKIKEPWRPNINSIIEVKSKKHFYVKAIDSKLSVYANQIEKVSESFKNNNDDPNLFNIQKSLINMRLIDGWLNG